MMKRYQVYIHTSTTSKKSYVGYTRLGINKRLHKHFTNAYYGIDNHFYRAIRKYGIDDFVSKVLYETDDQIDALKKEKYYIELYDTYVHGYNMSMGGLGGNIIRLLDDERYNNFIDKKIKQNSGKNNPNYSGYSDDDIIEYAKQCFLEHGHWHKKYWLRDYVSKYNIPKTFSKCRFNGKGDKGFKETLMNSLINDGHDVDASIFDIKRDEETKKLLSDMSKGRKLSHEHIQSIKDGLHKRDKKDKKPVSDETKKILSEKIKGRNWYTNINTKEKRMLHPEDARKLDNNWIKGYKK